jgi:hypothetical protein
MLDGSLFTRDFLAEGITQESDWKRVSDSDAKALAAKIEALFSRFPHSRKPNESQTEDDIVWPVLEALGWTDHLRQQNLSARGRDDVPDGLLFADADAKARANRHPEEWRRYEHGLAIVESKRWNRLLDRPDRGKDDQGVPSTQIIRYLRRVEDLTSAKLRWGILTNGRYWRLYYQGARSVSEDFLELDLAAILGLAPYADLLAPKDETERSHWLKVFALMFRRDAFLPGATDPRPFHIRALEQGHFWEEKVARSLSELVFERVFPDLARGLAANDPAAPPRLSAAYFEEVRNSALILLYRLLFVLYAEDRNLLPVNDHRYEDYGLRAKVREDVHARIDKRDAFSSTAGNYYGHMKGLFRAIAKGDAALGLPPYNGGLFEPSAAPILARAELPDSVIAPVIDALSRREEDGRKVYINYRDLSVQQLGSIYERLLEYQLRAEAAAIVVLPNVFTRKGSGSYYTPDELVSLIIDRTIGPLIDERLRAFAHEAERLACGRAAKIDGAARRISSCESARAPSSKRAVCGA